jgi:hypothetical protein
MITVADIKKKVVAFPDNKPVEELIDEIILLYKVQRGVEDIKKGNTMTMEEFEKEIAQWLQYK